MHNEREGWERVRVRDYDVYVPPRGYGVDPRTGRVEYVGVTDFGSTPEDRFYRRLGPPEWYAQAAADEAKVRRSDPSYVHPELEEYRQTQWQHRHYGQWFVNGDEYTYITGAHWFFLNAFYMGLPFNGGYGTYRESDRLFFYVAAWVMESPTISGLIYVTKRREGKTAKAVCLALWMISDEMEVNLGIQSQTEEDAKQTVYEQSLWRAYQRLPPHFKPMRAGDGRKGIPKELHFVNERWKGEADVESGLDSKCLYRASGETAFDGMKLRAYIGDEVFKTKACDVLVRHGVTLKCTQVDRRPWGLMIYSSTVEEIEGSLDTYIKFWQSSDWTKAVHGKTPTRLVQYFLSADEASVPDFTDKWGRVDSAAQREEILQERALLEGDPKAQQHEMRMNPLDIREAFRAAGGGGMFDSAKINRRLDELSFLEAPVKRGKLKWVGAVRDSEVVFVEGDGPWVVHEAACGEGAAFYPSLRRTPRGYELAGGSPKAVVGVDPYDHDNPQDISRASDGAAAVYLRDNPDEALAGNFAALYCHRPRTKELFYEEVIKAARYFDAAIFIENQKRAIVDYAAARGYHGAFARLPGRKEVGVASSKQSKQVMADAIEAYVDDHCHRVAFASLLKDFLAFDIAHTQAYDLTMAAGWALFLDVKLSLRHAAHAAVQKAGSSTASAVLNLLRRR